MNNLFYHPDLQTGSQIEFNEEESRHLKVFRMPVGSTIQVTDGKGYLAEAVILSDKKSLRAEVNSCVHITKKSFECSIAVAPTKNQERLEWFVEKATELGVGKIILFTSSNSEKPRVNGARLQRITISAIKQSHRVYMPEISELLSFDEMIKNSMVTQNYMAHCRSERKRTLLRKAIEIKKDSLILIGPEGDFNSDEIDKAESVGFVSVSLGESRLRTETAALSALLTFDILNQDK